MNQELKFVYGLSDCQVRQIVLGDGHLSSKNNALVCTSGNNPGSMAAIQGISPIFFTNDSVEVTFTAKFDAPVPGTVSVIGVGDNEAGCLVGYNNGKFGAAVSVSGNMQYYLVDLTSGATSNNDLLIGLNNVTMKVQCSAGDSIPVIQQKVASVVTQFGYLSYSFGSGVWVMSLQPQPSVASPTLSANNTGVQGTITLKSEGVTPNTCWVYADDWNGVSASNIVSTIDWSSGNMFIIELDPLGYGTISYHIIEPQSGTKTLLHSFNQRNTKEPLNLPSGLWPAMYCQNLGGNPTSLCTTGFMIKGSNYLDILRNKSIMSAYCHYESISLDKSAKNMMTIASSLLVTHDSGNRNTKLIRNRKTVLVKTLYLSLDCTVPCVISIYKNGITSKPVKFDTVDQNSCVVVNRDNTTSVTGNPTRSYYTVAAPTTIELTVNGVALAPLNTFNITCMAVSDQQVTANIGMQVSWSEM